MGTKSGTTGDTEREEWSDRGVKEEQRRWRRRGRRDVQTGNGARLQDNELMKQKT